MGLLRATLALVGLAPAGQLQRLSDRASAADQRAEDFKRGIADARAEITRWKEKAAQLEKAAERLAKIERELIGRKERDDSHVELLRRARERLERAERAVALSQEHLLATEAKLDVVEGAITVLDGRTRAALTASSPRENA